MYGSGDEVPVTNFLTLKQNAMLRQPFVQIESRVETMERRIKKIQRAHNLLQRKVYAVLDHFRAHQQGYDLDMSEEETDIVLTTDDESDDEYIPCTPPILGGESDSDATVVGYPNVAQQPESQPIEKIHQSLPIDGDSSSSMMILPINTNY